ncbi:MAG TPA: iron ABC transporter permease [Longimicrobiales bacterium]|nr:iron ABC transporter permease [Longimicrobiales bacterium]
MRLLSLGLLLVVAAVLAVGVGSAGLPLGDVIDALRGGADEPTRVIVWELRLPRVLLAALVGGALALAGAVFQALLRNPLADPYVLGVSGGAAVGAVLSLAVGADQTSPAALPLAALAGALGATALVFRIASAPGRALDTRVLLLAGVIAGAFFNALILLLLTFASAETFRSAIFWMMGNLAGAGWRAPLVLGVFALPASAALIALSRPLNLLAIGEDTALYLGIRTERVKLAAYFLASLLVAGAVAAAGVIGFIGLVVPHALRLAWGADHRLLLPACLLAGGAFLIAADTLARSVTGAMELPVGVVTALVGVPVFAFLLRRSLA